MSKWDRSSKDDFNEAAKGSPDKQTSDADIGKPKDQENLTDTYNQNANTAWDRQNQQNSPDSPNKEEKNLTKTFNEKARK